MRRPRIWHMLRLVFSWRPCVPQGFGPFWPKWWCIRCWSDSLPSKLSTWPTSSWIPWVQVVQGHYRRWDTDTVTYWEGESPGKGAGPHWESLARSWRDRTQLTPSQWRLGSKAKRGRRRWSQPYRCLGRSIWYLHIFTTLIYIDHIYISHIFTRVSMFQPYIVCRLTVCRG